MRRPIVPVAALLLTLASGSAFAAPEAPAPSQGAAKKSTQAAPKTAPAKQTAAKPQPGKAPSTEPTRAKSELKPVGVPGVKETVLTPEQVKAQQAEWRKLEEKERAERKARREKYKALVASYAKEGIDFDRADKPNTYRVIAPLVAKTADPVQRKAAAKALVTRLKRELEPILKKKLTFEVYADDKATQRIAY